MNKNKNITHLPLNSLPQNTTMFIGGLPRHTTEEAVLTVLTAIGKVLKLTLISDKKTGKPRGYGFFLIRTTSVENFLKNDVVINEKTVDISTSKKSIEEVENPTQVSTRLFFLSDFPFENEMQPVLVLEPFGEIKISHLYKDYENRSKGYGYLDFVELKDFKRLKNLYKINVSTEKSTAQSKSSMTGKIPTFIQFKFFTQKNLVKNEMKKIKKKQNQEKRARESEPLLNQSMKSSNNAPVTHPDLHNSGDFKVDRYELNSRSSNPKPEAFLFKGRFNQVPILQQQQNRSDSQNFCKMEKMEQLQNSLTQ